MGWVAPLLIIIVILGGYRYLTRPYQELAETQTRSEVPGPATEVPLKTEELRSERQLAPEATTATQPREVTAQQGPPPNGTAAKTENSGPSSRTSFAEMAASDIEKILAAGGRTAAAGGEAPRIIRVNEVVVFYDDQTRVLRAKVEILKNLVADAPSVINGRLFVVLKPNGNADPDGIITLPRIPLDGQKMANFSTYGEAFSLEDHHTSYIKTTLTEPPSPRQHMTLYVFDNRQNLLLRETLIIQIKAV